MHYYFITGTSRGIGKALVEKILDRKDTYVFGYSRGCNLTHDNYYHFNIDLNNAEHVSELTFPPFIDAESISLVNNSGALGDIGPVGALIDSGIANAYLVNALAPSILMNKFIRSYQDDKVRKVILNVSSGAGRHVIESWSAYCAAKAALDMFSQVAAAEQNEYWKNKTHIFSIAPGVVDTHMQDEIRLTDKEYFHDVNRFIEMKNNNKLSSAEEVADKLLKVLDTPEKFDEVLLDVRNF